MPAIMPLKPSPPSGVSRARVLSSCLLTLSPLGRTHRGHKLALGGPAVGREHPVSLQDVHRSILEGGRQCEPDLPGAKADFAACIERGGRVRGQRRGACARVNVCVCVCVCGQGGEGLAWRGICCTGARMSRSSPACLAWRRPRPLQPPPRAAERRGRARCLRRSRLPAAARSGGAPMRAA